MAGLEAWVGGKSFTPHPTIQELATAPTMMDDQIALPALRLILGDYSGADFKNTNTLEKAGLASRIWLVGRAKFVLVPRL